MSAGDGLGLEFPNNDRERGIVMNATPDEAIIEIKLTELKNRLEGQKQ